MVVKSRPSFEVFTVRRGTILIDYARYDHCMMLPCSERYVNSSCACRDRQTDTFFACCCCWKVILSRKCLLVDKLQASNSTSQWSVGRNCRSSSTSGNEKDNLQQSLSLAVEKELEIRLRRSNESKMESKEDSTKPEDDRKEVYSDGSTLPAAK